MDFDKICYFAEQLRVQLTPDPEWNPSKHVFEYKEIDVKVVSVLKALRAVQGLKSLEILCFNGLFIDMGALWRCVYDCVAEIYFLLENYPESSSQVEKFISYFSSLL